MMMNEMDVRDAVVVHRPEVQPNLHQAALHLQQLVEWVNSVSDGWSYWHRAHRGAKRLMDLLQAHRWSLYGDADDCTEAEVRRALVTAKAFITRNGGDWREVFS